MQRARDAGLEVVVEVPVYDDPTWTGYVPGNPQIYMGWETPEDHPAIQCVANVYRQVVSALGWELTPMPSLDRRSP